jgi:hypothetical protein
MFQDFHIDDWNPEFLSKLDPREFPNNVAVANCGSASVMANTCTGKCSYPTKVGVMHAALTGRDVYGEWIDHLRENGIKPFGYYITIYVDWYWDNFPEARIVSADGKSEKILMPSSARPRRFSTCCPNNPGYRKFVADQLEEICSAYQFDGFYVDMCFWPMVCYCPSCRQRYAKEVGGEMPTTVNWEDPVWVQFVSKRQEWITDFAHLTTSTIRKHQPNIPIGYQASPFFADWTYGGSVELSQEMDWLWADIYRDKYGFSLYAKLFDHLSEKKPFEYLSGTASPDITEHVITLSEDEIRTRSFSAFINNGAKVFIDAVDPVGTFHLERYERIGKVFSEVEQYESKMEGEFLRDVGIFYSYEASFDFAENGLPVPATPRGFNMQSTAPGQSMHMMGAVYWAKTLTYAHIPYGVVTRKNLQELDTYQIVVLPNVMMLCQEETDALRSYVERGGSLWASKNTSLLSAEGEKINNFLLSDLFGVSYAGEAKEVVTYVAPKEKYRDLFGSFSPDFPVTLYDTQALVKADKNAEVLATVTFPYTDPKGTRYASILTDPPGIPSEYPSIVLNRFGKGIVLYTAGAIETWSHDSQREVTSRLLERIATRPFYVETDAPKAVEITLLRNKQNNSYVLNLLNIQQELPNIAVHGINLKVWMNQDVPKKLVRLPGGESIPFETKDNFMTVTLPVLKDYCMLEIVCA